MEQLQSHIHIWLTASSYMGKYLRIFSYIRKPFLIYDFATAPLWISLYVRKILFHFYQCIYYRHAHTVLHSSHICNCTLHFCLLVKQWTGGPWLLERTNVLGVTKCEHNCRWNTSIKNSLISIRTVCYKMAWKSGCFSFLLSHTACM